MRRPRPSRPSRRPAGGRAGVRWGLTIAIGLAASEAGGAAPSPSEARSTRPTVDGERGGGGDASGTGRRLLPPARVSRWFGALLVGRALRLDNPYRLTTPLGETPQSVSLAAPFLDLALGATAGPPARVEHGGIAVVSTALSGIRQHVFTPGYVAAVRPSARWLARARVGVPIVVDPDSTLGFEVAAGATWYTLAGVGLTAELSAAVFAGAATYEHQRTTIPIVGCSVGGWLDYEVWR